MMPLEFTDEVGGNVVGVHFAVHMSFTHTACDELRHLASEIENKNAIV
jgi:hypothetical protein